MKQKLLLVVVTLIAISVKGQQTNQQKQSLDELAQDIGTTMLKAYAGDAEVQYELGNLYRKGLIPGIFETPDEKEATSWYVKSAEGGSLNGMVALAGSYLFGKGIFKKDISKAIEWYKKAAKKGSPYAMYALGMSEQEGWLSNPNPFKAFEYLKKAADGGMDQAAYEVTNHYYSGLNYPQDYEKAVYYFNKVWKNRSLIQIQSIPTHAENYRHVIDLAEESISMKRLRTGI